MDVNLIGVPLFFGSDVRGVDFGPAKLREKDIDKVISRNNHTVRDLGNLKVDSIPEDSKFSYHPKMKYLQPIVDVNQDLADYVYNSLASESFPFIVGGDHSLGLGSISGASKYYKNLAVIWVDAHTDINTPETTPSGNVHGMPLAAAMGRGIRELTDLYFEGVKVNPENVFIIGARDIDSGEQALIDEMNLNVYSTMDVHERGMKSIMDEIYQQLQDNGVDAVHLSFDIDCLDFSLVPGTGTPVQDGMTVLQAKYLLKYMMSTSLVKSLDIVELNAALDRDDSTADLVIDLVDWTFKYLQ